MGQETKRTRGQIDRLGDAYKERLALALLTLDALCTGERNVGVEIETIKLKLGWTDHTDTLAIVTATADDGGPVVGFNSASTPAEALIGAINKVANTSMEWREDGFRTGSKG